MSILWLFTILVSRGVVTIGNKVRRSGKDSLRLKDGYFL
jgi:hypothetical protein